MRHKFWKIALRLAMCTSLVGTMSAAGCLNKVGRNLNPCGTILNCDPAEWDWMMHRNDYPDLDIDPTCVIPGMCGGSWPPTTGGGGAGGGGGGGTTTPTTPTTGGTTTPGGFGTGFGGGFGF
jgi:hypothetical protein